MVADKVRLRLLLLRQRYFLTSDRSILFRRRFHTEAANTTEHRAQNHPYRESNSHYISSSLHVSVSSLHYLTGKRKIHWPPIGQDRSGYRTSLQTMALPGLAGDFLLGIMP